MYLVWLERRTRSEVAEVLRGRWPTSCWRSSPLRLTIDVLGPGERHPRARAHARGRDAAARGGLALARRRRTPGPFEEVLARPPRLAGYSVVESLYRDYGGNQWGPADLARRRAVPGVLTVALLQQHPDQTFEDWMTRWHTRISPITEAIQPRIRYVRNAVFRP